MEKTTRSRLTLLAVAAVFAAPLLTALALRLSGWRPQHTRNYGALVQPPVDVSVAPVTLAGGALLDWRDPQWHWTLLALSSGDCAQACRTRLAELQRMRITLGRNAERLRIVHVGTPLPQDAAAALAPIAQAHDDRAALAAYAPREDGALALALVDPNGLLMLRYDAGYDAGRLRQDIVRVVH